MDNDRFDTLVRSLAPVCGRRTAVTALGLLALGIGAGPARQSALGRRRRRRHRCNPACPVCQACNTRRGRCQPGPDASCGACRTCQHGQCVAAREGESCGECHVCRAGSCAPAADGVSCAECVVCRAGACTQTAADATPCRGTGQCGSGRCFPAPACAPALSGDCDPATGAPCCSGVCVFAPPLFPATCDYSLTGDQCLTDSDCAAAAGLRCRVFLCVP